LVGSTALSARMDPEDLREIISAYQKCVAVTVQRFGGFVVCKAKMLMFLARDEVIPNACHWHAFPPGARKFCSNSSQSCALRPFCPCR
jgi:hypothetical protein